MNAGTSRRPLAQLSTSPAGDAVSIRLRLIGQMEAWSLTSESVLPIGRKTRALLAILALSAPRPMLRGRLAEMLWSRRPEEQARASLRQEIHRLLHSLGSAGQSVLLVNRDHLALRAGAAWVDVDEVLRATPGKPAALALLDGELLEDLNDIDSVFDSWLAGERDRLRNKARGLAEIMLRDLTEPDAAIAAAQQLLTIDRTHEGAWRALMRAHAARGERGMAIQAFERCRTLLSDQLQSHPSDETLRLLAEIRASNIPRAATTSGLPIRSEARPAPRGERSLEPRAEVAVERKAEPQAHPQRGGPRIGVLPLQLAGMAGAEAHLGTGLAEEITGALARFRWMFLVSSSTLARFAAQTRDETAIRRAFDIHYLLDGSVQRVHDRLRVSLRLLDLRAGNQVVWSWRVDRESADPFALQDEVAAETAARVDAELLMLEAQRVTARPGPDSSAYDSMLRALPMIGRMEQASFMRAGELLRQAVAMDPEYAAAHGWLAHWCVLLVRQDWADETAEMIAEAGRLADQAVALDPQDARMLAIAGHVRAFLNRRTLDAMALHQRSLALNPNLAMAWGLSGITYLFAGDLDEAERRLLRYKTLSPQDPHSFYIDTGLALAALLKGEHMRAAGIGREVSETNPNFSGSYKPLLSAVGHLGRSAEAAILRERLLAVEPRFSIRRFMAGSALEQPEHLAHYAAGLRLAGVPEE